MPKSCPESPLLPAMPGHATRMLRHEAPDQHSYRSRNANPATNGREELAQVAIASVRILGGLKMRTQGHPRVRVAGRHLRNRRSRGRERKRHIMATCEIRIPSEVRVREERNSQRELGGHGCRSVRFRESALWIGMAKRDKRGRPHLVVFGKYARSALRAIYFLFLRVF